MSHGNQNGREKQELTSRDYGIVVPWELGETTVKPPKARGLEI